MNGAIVTKLTKHKGVTMSNTLAQNKFQLDELFCNNLNEAVAKIRVINDDDPNNLSSFFMDKETGLPYCRLFGGQCLSVRFDVNSKLVDGTIQVFVSISHPDYGHHALYLLMDVPMLELYKDYLTQFIDGAIDNEKLRVLTLSAQTGRSNRH